MDELKEKILKGVRADRYAFIVPGSEIKEHFTPEALEQWASDNSLTYYRSPATGEYYFAVSPSLAAMKAAERGIQAMIDNINQDLQIPSPSRLLGQTSRSTKEG